MKFILINNIKIFNKIIGYSLMMLILFVGVVVLKFMPEFENAIYSEKEINIMQNVEVAYSVFESKYKMFLDGKLTEKEAKAQAAKSLKLFRYDNGKGYFWINDYEPNMIMHPLKPELDGKSLKNNADPNGKKLFVEMAKVVKKNGEGFVDYQWAKPGKEAPVDKISYVKGFDKWGWMIGTGIYIDDVEDKISSVYATFLWILILLTGIALIFTYALAKNISRPLKALQEMSNKVAEGNVDVSIAENRGDELGLLAKSFNKMTSNIKALLSEVEQKGIVAEKAANEAKEAQALTHEQGRGFAVVADEVRKLAERTTKATKEIAKTINEIQTEAKEADKSMGEAEVAVNEGMKLNDEVGDVLSAILVSAENVAQQITQVAAASEEQSATAEEVSSNIESINNVANESAAVVQQIATASEDLNRLTENLSQIVEQFRLDDANNFGQENRLLG